MKKFLGKVLQISLFATFISLLLTNQPALAAWSLTDEIHADAIYREGAFGYNHAGVFYNNGTLRGAYEARGDGPVVFSYMDDFINGETYFGSYYQWDVDTSTERNYIIQTCSDLANNATLGYTWSNCLIPESNHGTWISPDEVSQIRCDGVVEYAYEWNNFMIWGKTDTGNQYGTPTHHDISYSSYYSEHNILGKTQPWIELSPYVQRGAAGLYWTYLGKR